MFRSIFLKFFLFLFSLLFLSSCGDLSSENDEQKVIKLALAGNVTYAIPELKKAFNLKYPDIKVDVILGSSGKLTAQIKNHAPFDVFMSANMKYPTQLKKDGFAITEPIIYAQGGLALITIKDLPISGNLNFLETTNINKIAIANPKTAPYGKASIEAFKNSKIYEQINSKLVFAETITQAVQYALTASDVGLIAKSSLYDKKLSQYKENKNWISVDRDLYTPINQGIVILKNAEKTGNLETAKLFYDFILSNEAKKIFESYGYIIN